MKNGETRQCEVCGDSFYVPPSAVKRGHGRYCSRKCKGEAQKTINGHCQSCGKELTRPGRKFCCYACFGESISKKKTVSCLCCGKEVQRSESKIRNDVFCSKTCHDQYQRDGKAEHVCKTCGKTFLVRGRNRKNVSFCSMSCRNEDPDFIAILARQNAKQQKKKGLNKLELAGRRIMEGIGASFAEQVFLFGKFTVDVFLEGYGIVIQWDGDYWHGNPKKYPRLNATQERSVRHDRSCNAYLRKCGLRVLRVWESDVKRHPDRVLTRIREACCLQGELMPSDYHLPYHIAKQAADAVHRMTPLEMLRDECLNCRKCRIGGVDIGGCKSNVFSTMNPEARVMVVGQNPGKDEVAQGIPFVGVSGKFFDKAASEVLGMTRSDFYISNVVRCFTPNNRAPSVVEEQNCRDFLDREITIVKPVVVITLGSPAFKSLTGMSGITKHHGTPIYSIRYRVYVLPLFHPSPLNMNSEEKRRMFYSGLEKVKEMLNECDCASENG